MSEKKLTKVQKEILTTLRDIPGAELTRWNFESPMMWVDNEIVKTINPTTFAAIRIFLKEEYTNSRNHFTFNPDAEISDAWRTQELERRRTEIQQKREESKRIKEQAEKELIARVSETFAAIERGEIDNSTIEYGYRVRFEHNGKWYNLVEEQQFSVWDIMSKSALEKLIK